MSSHRAVCSNHCADDVSLPPGEAREEYGVCSSRRAVSLPPGEAREEYGVPPGEACEIIESEGGADARRKLERHMQCRLLGHVMRAVYTAQDFVASCCKMDTRGVISEEKKRCVAYITRLLIPWVEILADLIEHKQLKRLLV